MNSALSLYDLLDFTEFAGEQDMGALKKYLEEAAANFSKTKTFNDSLIRPPQIETGYANLVFSNLRLTSLRPAQGSGRESRDDPSAHPDKDPPDLQLAEQFS